MEMKISEKWIQKLDKNEKKYLLEFLFLLYYFI